MLEPTRLYASFLGHPLSRRPLIALASIALAGCGAPPPKTSAAPASACALAASSPPDSLVVAALQPADPTHVAAPANATERFVFAQSYETLIDVGCEQRPIPGLAQQWTLDATRTRVSLTLRIGAHFWTGDPIRAADVVAAWRTTSELPGDAGRLARRIADATTVVDERTLVVSLPDTTMRLLADPALAITRRGADRWMEGSGAYRPIEWTTARIVLAAVGPGPKIVMNVSRLANARDAIDAGSDIVPSAGPIAVSYASNRAELTSIALPWTRTYALAVPRKMAPPQLDSLASVSFRTSLARDAVRAEARAADTPDWWNAAPFCPMLTPIVSPAAAAAPSRIVYRRDDPIARAIAERLVAVSPRTTAAPMTPPELERSLRAGLELAYVVDVPRESLIPCAAAATLASNAPWLDLARGDLVPLVDVRERAIVRRDRVAAMVMWDGTLKISHGSPR